MTDDEEKKSSEEPIRRAAPPSMTLRARRRREEAVRRLVADVQTKKDDGLQEWLVATTVAAALEKGLDREFHTELVQETKDNAARIGQICHDHADVFLTSVAQVAALGEPSAELAEELRNADKELHARTAGPMLQAAQQWQHATHSHQRAQALYVMIQACQQVAVQLERARKQATAGRSRAALDAVDQARAALAMPMKLGEQKEIENLEQTPFGKRALVILPKIENEVLQSAKRSLNRWFLSLRSGDAIKAGRAVLVSVADSMAIGPGQLGLGGQLPSSYIWRAKTADNIIARVTQNARVARAVRQGYWFDRDAPKEAERLELCEEGLPRRADALAAAFGWFRCWDEQSSLLLDPVEFEGDERGTAGSRHGSRHGLRGSRHGSSQHKRSLGFRATTSSQSKAFQEVTSSLGNAKIKAPGKSSKWNEVLTPTILQGESSKRSEDMNIFMTIPESCYPVRRAELAFQLLNRSEEFIQYYEQNRFGETKIATEDGKGERKSFLSSIISEDVTAGSDRIFFAKTLPTLCASVVGFAAVEAALEMGNFAADEQEDRASNKGNKTNSALNATRFREASERYERALLHELGNLLRARARKATHLELVRSSSLMAALRVAMKMVHPSSSARRNDKELVSLDVDILMTTLKIAQSEQLRAVAAIVADDVKEPLIVADSYMQKGTTSSIKKTGIPDPEEVGFPFGLSQMKQAPKRSDIEFQEQARTSYNRAPPNESYTFSASVPDVLRSLHARCIACAAFTLTLEELGQKFPDKKGSPSAGFVLDCVEECINVTAVGMKDSHKTVGEGSVEKAVQVMANIHAMQHCLPRLFGTMMRGMCHVGLIRADEIEETFLYAEKCLKSADKACDAQVGSAYSLVYEICRNKIDTHLNYALENFNWVAKTTRESPNPYCEGLIAYLRNVFASLGPMDEGSRAGLHFSCCGHVAERLVKMFSDKPGDTTSMDSSVIPPIARIDAFGIKNMALDCESFEKFADDTGIPQLRDCFNELRVLTSVMLDKELPKLLLPENAAARRKKYPIMSLEKVANILEKYVGTGLGDKLMGGAGRGSDILFMEKKEVQQLVKIVRAQVIT